MNFRLVCPNCIAMTTKHSKPEESNAFAGAVNSLGQIILEHNLCCEIAEMKQSMVKISPEIATMLDIIKSIASIIQPALPSSGDTSNFNQSPSCTARSDVSYAVAISGNLSQEVNSAVMETFRTEKAVKQDNASEAIHNMKEYGKNMHDVQELLDFLECNVQVVNTACIGKYDKLSKKARLLKVELRSVLDKNAILQVSKYVKDDLSIAKIFITKWLQQDEMKEL